MVLSWGRNRNLSQDRSQEISTHTYKNLVYDEDEATTDNSINDVVKQNNHL